MPREQRVQAVLDLKSNDIQGRWGVAQVRQRLANQDVLIPRCVHFHQSIVLWAVGLEPGHHLSPATNGRGTVW